MNGNRTLAAGSLLAAAAVGFGAFGAHGLKETLEANGEQYVAAWDTAAQYHLVAALAIMVCGLAAPRFQCKGAVIAAWMLGVGSVLFSGSLYALAVTKISKLGMITPLGGLSLILGFVALGWTSFTCSEK